MGIDEREIGHGARDLDLLRHVESAEAVVRMGGWSAQGGDDEAGSCSQDEALRSTGGLSRIALPKCGCFQ
jgi:hypothetical protein